MQNITHSSNQQTACIKKKEAVACIWTQAFYFFKVLNTLCDTFLRGGLCLDMDVDMMQHNL